MYVPHPFDRMHSVPDYEHLLTILDDVDAIEVFNPRVAIGAFNDEAARFAAKYRIVAGAGSDSHVAQGLGSVRIRMRDFDGPARVPAVAARRRDPHAPSSLLYVQALKFLQTRATPASARRASRARRVKRRERSAADGRGRTLARAQGLMHRQGQARPLVKSLGVDACDRRRDPREVPRARHPRAEHAHARAAGLPALPARQPDAGARLRASAGRHHAAQVLARCPRRSRRASPSTGAPAGR